MKSPSSQDKRILDRLLEEGRVSRNWCLERRITRLGAIMCRLKERGYEYRGHYEETTLGKDYVYELVDVPWVEVERKLYDGDRFIRSVIVKVPKNEREIIRV